MDGPRAKSEPTQHTPTNNSNSGTTKNQWTKADDFEMGKQKITYVADVEAAVTLARNAKKQRRAHCYNVITVTMKRFVCCSRRCLSSDYVFYTIAMVSSCSIV